MGGDGFILPEEEAMFKWMLKSKERAFGVMSPNQDYCFLYCLPNG